MSWLRRLFTRCTHETIRCVHGDEIIFAANFRRACCTQCGRYLDLDLPEPCSVTNKPHPTTEAAPNRAASFTPGDIVTVNNPGSVWHEEAGRVRYSVDSCCARIDFADMRTALVRHEHLTKGKR